MPKEKSERSIGGYKYSKIDSKPYCFRLHLVLHSRQTGTTLRTEKTEIDVSRQGVYNPPFDTLTSTSHNKKGCYTVAMDVATLTNDNGT